MLPDPGCKNDIAAFISAIPADLHNRILLHTVGIDNRLALRVPVCGRIRAPPGFEEKIAAHYRSRVHGQYTRGRLYCFSIHQFFVTDAYGKLYLAREIFTEYTVTSGVVTRARQFTAFEPSRLGTGSRQRWVCTGRVSPDPKLPDLHSYPWSAYMHDVGESPLWLIKVRPFLTDLARAFSDSDPAAVEDHWRRILRIDFDSFDD